MQFDSDCSGRTVAEAIGPGLAKAIGYKVVDEIRDLDRAITEDCSITIITAKDDDPDAQFLLRHSAAHVLAEAVCDLIPGTKLAMDLLSMVASIMTWRHPGQSPRMIFPQSKNACRK